MSTNLLSGGALTVVSALFVIIFMLRKKGVNFSVVILGALIAGAVIGTVFQGHTDWVNPLGKIYVSILSALVIPLIIISIVSSVTSLSSIAQLKGIGSRSVFWLLTTTAISIVLALGLALTFGIGHGSGISIQGVNAANYKGALASFSQVLIGLFPRNVVGDINDERIVPIILFSVLIAVSYVLAAHDDAEKVAPFKRGVEALKVVIFKAVAFIIELTPYAVLALTATVTSNGLSSSGIMWSLLVLLLVSFVAFAIDTYAVNAVLLKVFADIDPIRFFKKILPAQVVGFSTQSSAGTLPLTTSILTERVGVGASVANFTASLGTTIGMPGCSGIWPVLVAVWGINGLGLQFGPSDYLRLAIISLVVSLGTAGVPGTATIVTAGVLTAVGLPLEILVLVIPISAIADTGRTATNITAAMVSSTIVARQEGVLDDAVFNDEHEYDPAGVPSPQVEGGEAPPSGAPERARSPRPEGVPAARVPVADPAYALLEADMGVGETCPF